MAEERTIIAKPVEGETVTTEVDTKVEAVFTGEENGTTSITIASEDVDVEGSPEAEESLEMPEKFANAEDPNQALLKAYKEMEKKLASGEAPEPIAEAEVTEGEPEVAEVPEESEFVKGYQDKWAEQGGKLTDEQWLEVSKTTGVPLDTLKAYEAGQVAQAQDNLAQNDTKIYGACGGQDSYDTMIKWAEQGGLTGEQIDAVNHQLDNPLFALNGVAILKGAFQAANGFEKTASVKNVATADTLGANEFHSTKEMHAAQGHKDYGKGGLYDREFDAKAMRLLKRQQRA